MRILLVEDDELLGSGIKKSLTKEGFQTDWLQDGQQALHAILDGTFSLLVLDLTLPSLDGMDILAQIRQQNIDLPVLILTARDSLDDKVKGLDRGADDYLVKPFEMRELKARIHAISRRIGGQSDNILSYDRLRLDTGSKTVFLDSEEVKLSRREYALLYELLSHPGRVYSRQLLEDTLYGWDTEVESNSIEVHIHHLRKKLYAGLIKNVRGVGYKVDKL